MATVVVLGYEATRTAEPTSAQYVAKAIEDEVCAGAKGRVVVGGRIALVSHFRSP